MPVTIYVVMGTTGEYSDREEWPVCAFRDRDAAEARVCRATELIRAWELARGSGAPSYTIPDEYHVEDANVRSDYTGTEYFIHAVELLDG